MKKFFPKKIFSVKSYDRHTFSPILLIFELKNYDVENENDFYVYINNTVFRKTENISTDTRYLYDFFYTEKEYRKLKLKKLNEI